MLVLHARPSSSLQFSRAGRSPMFPLQAMLLHHHAAAILRARKQKTLARHYISPVNAWFESRLTARESSRRENDKQLPLGSRDQKAPCILPILPRSLPWYNCSELGASRSRQSFIFRRRETSIRRPLCFFILIIILELPHSVRVPFLTLHLF
jgi:hypothetical protein